VAIFLYSAVHLARFASNGSHLFSGSDDKTVRLWDAATESELHCFTDHQVLMLCSLMNDSLLYFHSQSTMSLSVSCLHSTGVS